MEGPWTIETSCLGLRQVTEEEMDETKNDPEHTVFIGALREALISDIEALPAKSDASASQSFPSPWAIVRKADGKPLGAMALKIAESDTNWVDANAILVISSEGFDQGLAHEATWAARERVRSHLQSTLTPEERSRAKNAHVTVSGRIVKRIAGAYVLALRIQAAA